MQLAGISTMTASKPAIVDYCRVLYLTQMTLSFQIAVWVWKYDEGPHDVIFAKLMPYQDMLSIDTLILYTVRECMSWIVMITCWYGLSLEALNHHGCQELQASQAMESTLRRCREFFFPNLRSHNLWMMDECLSCFSLMNLDLLYIVQVQNWNITHE